MTRVCQAVAALAVACAPASLHPDGGHSCVITVSGPLTFSGYCDAAAYDQARGNQAELIFSRIEPPGFYGGFFVTGPFRPFVGTIPEGESAVSVARDYDAWQATSEPEAGSWTLVVTATGPSEPWGGDGGIAYAQPHGLLDATLPPAGGTTGPPAVIHVEF